MFWKYRWMQGTQRRCIATFSVCVWLPAGWGTGQWSSEADWLVDGLVEVIGQMTLKLSHRETRTYSCDYWSYTQEEDTLWLHTDNMIIQTTLACDIIYSIYISFLFLSFCSVKQIFQYLDNSIQQQAARSYSNRKKVCLLFQQQTDNTWNLGSIQISVIQDSVIFNKKCQHEKQHTVTNLGGRLAYWSSHQMVMMSSQVSPWCKSTKCFSWIAAFV